MFEEKYVDHKRVYVLKPAKGLKNALGFLGRFFSRRNVSCAFRSVTRDFREYLPFFAACFALQLIFWAGMVYADIRLATAKKEAYAAADCHVIVDGLTSDEKAAIENGRLWVAQHLSPSERMYESYSFEAYRTSLGATRYEMHILLDEDSRSRADDFLSYYSVGGAGSHSYYTERITMTETAAARATQGKTIFFIVSLLFSAVSLMILFNIRTNHYKFMYGVYMSFGAGFEKLFETALWELFMISVLTFVPAALVGVGADALIYLPRGAKFSMSAATVALAVLFDLLAVFAATALPVLVLSKKTPVSLLTAEDNSNLVSSPRRSAYIFGKRFPATYEFYGMFRFRRYFAGLLVGAVSFSTVFLCGIFLSDRRADIDSAPKPQFTVTAPEGIDAIDLELAPDIAGVDYLTWDVSTKAAAMRSHVVLTQRAAGSRGYTSTKAQDGENVATNSVKYAALDGLLIDTVTSHGLWKVEGDLSSVLSDPYTVAVSEYIYNGRELNFKVGDTIKVAVLTGVTSPIDQLVTDARLNLEQEIKKGEFEFTELRVGAVIDTGTAEDCFIVGMSPELYTTLTGEDTDVKKAFVYLDAGTDAAGARNAFIGVREMFSDYSGYSVYDSLAASDGILRSKTDIRGVTLACLAAVLALSPLVWFFSQSMFFTKREGEFYMLGAFGATDGKLRSLHLFSGGVTAAASFVVSFLLGGISGYLSFMLLDNWLPKYGFTEAVRHSFGMPWVACVICLVVSAACGFASALAPYRRYIKKRDRVACTQLGE